MTKLTFGQWIQEQMDIRRLSGRECAKNAGVSPQAWSEWVNDRTRRKNDAPRRITPQTVRKIAVGLGISEAEVTQAVVAFNNAEYVTEAPITILPNNGPALDVQRDGRVIEYATKEDVAELKVLLRAELKVLLRQLIEHGIPSTPPLAEPAAANVSMGDETMLARFSAGMAPHFADAKQKQAQAKTVAKSNEAPLQQDQQQPAATGTPRNKEKVTPQTA